MYQHATGNKNVAVVYNAAALEPPVYAIKQLARIAFRTSMTGGRKRARGGKNVARHAFVSMTPDRQPGLN
ncbi:MAG TPA: hypothetical protein VMJ11_03750 [Paraburkholderia sp.]|uniref:hypothetical protein n=1 Tax=Paraburkholderia sp. TaxID=1926495 RepID=UPI002C7DDB5F|nr:hypothetical protein [Paraburkholderia sp.]HTR05771.1 hypothetical protein [Paraburkholderia sp.]